MLRIFALIALLAGCSYLADAQLHRNCEAVSQECSKGRYGGARMALDCEPIVFGIHEAERITLLALAGLTLLSFTFRRGLLHETFTMFWGLGLLVIACMLGLSGMYEMIADGFEQQNNYHASLADSAIWSCLSDLVGVGTVFVLGILVGPPGGWSGQDSPELL